MKNYLSIYFCFLIETRGNFYRWPNWEKLPVNPGEICCYKIFKRKRFTRTVLTKTVIQWWKVLVRYIVLKKDIYLLFFVFICNVLLTCKEIMIFFLRRNDVSSFSPFPNNFYLLFVLCYAKNVISRKYTVVFEYIFVYYNYHRFFFLFHF